MHLLRPSLALAFTIGWACAGLAQTAPPPQVTKPAASANPVGSSEPTAPSASAADSTAAAGAVTDTAQTNSPAPVAPSVGDSGGAQSNAASSDQQDTATSTQPGQQPEPATSRELVVATYDGAYGEAQALAFFAPFTGETGINLTVRRHGEAAAIRAAIAAPGWDVADIPADLALEACSKGLIEPIDPLTLAPDTAGLAGADDFLPGGLQRCAVASAAWSAVLIATPQPQRGKTIDTLADVFDPRRFKGKRAFPRNPRYLMELALMADGVQPVDVYTLLATPEGQQRAIAKLKPLRDSIVWWTRPEEALKLVASGQAIAGMAYNGRAFMEEMAGTRLLKTIWDGQIYDLNAWVIAKGSPRAQDAMRFVAFATRPDRLAEAARLFPYGPMRRSALPLVGTNPALGVSMLPHLPTAPGNMSKALRFDAGWWDRNEPAVRQQFDSLLAASG